MEFPNESIFSSFDESARRGRFVFVQSKYFGRLHICCTIMCSTRSWNVAGVRVIDRGVTPKWRKNLSCDRHSTQEKYGNVGNACGAWNCYRIDFLSSLAHSIIIIREPQWQIIAATVRSGHPTHTTIAGQFQLHHPLNGYSLSWRCLAPRYLRYVLASHALKWMWNQMYQQFHSHILSWADWCRTRLPSPHRSIVRERHSRSTHSRINRAKTNLSTKALPSSRPLLRMINATCLANAASWW